MAGKGASGVGKWKAAATAPQAHARLLVKDQPCERQWVGGEMARGTVSTPSC